MQEAASIKDPRQLAELNLSINLTEKWITDHKNEFEYLVTHSIKQRRSKRGIFNQYNAILRFNVEKFLANINNEVLVIHGTDDLILPYANAKLIASKIKNSKLITLENVGHMFWIMAPDISNTIRQFLAAKSSL